MAHTLKGTSGSYGFDELSAELRRIEEGLEGLIEEAPADAWERIGHALARARDALGPPPQPSSSHDA